MAAFYDDRGCPLMAVTAPVPPTAPTAPQVPTVEGYGAPGNPVPDFGTQVRSGVENARQAADALAQGATTKKNGDGKTQQGQGGQQQKQPPATQNGNKTTAGGKTTNTQRTEVPVFQNGDGETEETQQQAAIPSPEQTSIDIGTIFFIAAIVVVVIGAIYIKKRIGGSVEESDVPIRLKDAIKDESEPRHIGHPVHAERSMKKDDDGHFEVRI